MTTGTNQDQPRWELPLLTAAGAKVPAECGGVARLRYRTAHRQWMHGRDRMQFQSPLQATPCWPGSQLLFLESCMTRREFGLLQPPAAVPAPCSYSGISFSASRRCSPAGAKGSKLVLKLRASIQPAKSNAAPTSPAVGRQSTLALWRSGSSGGASMTAAWTRVPAGAGALAGIVGCATALVPTWAALHCQ